MSHYIYERAGWPRFRWDQNAVVGPLAAVRHRQGRRSDGWRPWAFLYAKRPSSKPSLWMF